MKRIVSEDSIVVAATDQVSSDLGGEVAILELTSGVYYGLNEVGARVWELVQEPVAVSEVRAAIVEEYEVEPARAERDVLALLHRLAHEGLIEVRNETPT